MAAIALLAPPAARADKPAGGAGPSAREDARRAIPWRSLSDGDRKTVSKVVGDATLYRQLPTRVIDCDPELFAYLIDHPEVVVDSWNVMGVSRLRVEPTGERRYRVTDSAGAVGDVRVVHRSGDGVETPLTMVVLADGVYRAAPMPRPIRGGSVLLLRAEAVEERNGRTYITTRLDSFLRMRGAATELVTHTLRPLITRTADHNFVETMRFVSLFSRTAETNPAGMQRLSEQLPRIDEPTRREFAAECHATAQRYAMRRSRVATAIRPVSTAVR
ncbi:MAG: hypothetical protein AAF805_02215 [Planctomycetota bacterium]